MKSIAAVLIFILFATRATVSLAESPLDKLSNDDVEWSLGTLGARPRLTGESKHIAQSDAASNPQDLLPLLADPKRFAAAHLILADIVGASGTVSGSEWLGLSVAMRPSDMSKLGEYWKKGMVEWEERKISNSEVLWKLGSDDRPDDLQYTLIGKARLISLGKTEVEIEELYRMLGDKERFAVAHLLLVEKAKKLGLGVPEDEDPILLHGLTVHIRGNGQGRYESADTAKLIELWRPLIHRDDAEF